MGLFLVSLLYSFDVSVSVSVPCFFDYYSFAVLSGVWEGYIPIFVLFHQDCLGNAESLMVGSIYVLGLLMGKDRRSLQD